MSTSLLFAIACTAISPVGALQIDAGVRTPSALIQVQGYERYSHRRHGGYHVNRYGYGNYTRGPDGGFGGYPRGSDGAKILRQQQRRKCQAVPEQC